MIDTLSADGIIRQSRNPESGPWILRRFVWSRMRYDILRLAGTHLIQIYESWLEVSATGHRPDDCIAHVCEMIHVLHNWSGDYETKAERRERARNRKRRNSGR